MPTAPAGTGRADEAALHHAVRAAAGVTVLTGGQTGVDTLAAAAAVRAGLTVHLLMPLGLRREDGRLTAARRRPFAGATVHELGSGSYRYRTWTCAYLADAVVLLDPAGGAGCRETARAAGALGRPLLQPAAGEVSAEQLESWLAEVAARVLMVAGCRASVLARKPGAGRSARTDATEVIAGAAAWHDRLLRDAR